MRPAFKAILPLGPFFRRYLWVVRVLILGNLPSFNLPAQTNTVPDNRNVVVDELYDVIDLTLSGLESSNEGWLRHFLDLETFPQKLSEIQLEDFRLKLMKTGVFFNVNVDVSETFSGSHKYHLHIRVEENWTLIPVIRAAYGGGVPLKVIGVYDLHSFGRLLTLGTEARQYGTDPWSIVAWAKSPQFWRGKYDTGIEFWNLIRRRDVYAKQRDIIQSYHQKETSIKGYAFTAIESHPFTKGKLQFGGEVQIKSKHYSLIDDRQNEFNDKQNDISIDLSESKASREYQLLPGLIYDDIIRQQSIFEGTRLVLKTGLCANRYENANKTEVEFFNYKLLPFNVNTAFHLFLGQNNLNEPINLYYLGGLDSVRSVPEGALTGRKAAISNFELRLITWRWHYLWLQHIAFVDYGAAGTRWANIFKNSSSAGGIGLRFIVPKVSRMVFRLDLAENFDHRSFEISAGMNQFFDPYRPL